MNKNIRNFAIIAHVDHGKSTLADRFLELTGLIDIGKHEAQILDRNPISRKRGITIKLAPVRMNYKLEGIEYILNLVDTPGHVDFSYEVERTLACVESAILLVDSTQGIQAQTVAHAFRAIEQNLVLIPAINKIDSSNAQVAKTKEAISSFLGINSKEIHCISAKTGEGVRELLNAVVRFTPQPKFSSLYGADSAKALIFDSYYDSHRGVIAFIRVFNGVFAKGQKLKLYASEAEFVSDEVGIFTPDLSKRESLSEGEIGYVVTKLKSIQGVRVGDTMCTKKADTPLPGYKKVIPMVYSSLFPTDPEEFNELALALEKLSLNDSALEYERIRSKSLGSGYRVGFLGLLHADVTRQRLEEEYGLDIVLTPPAVDYKSEKQGAKTIYSEPIVKIQVVVPQGFLSAVMKISKNARADLVHMDNKGDIIFIDYEMPLSELISGYFDKLKSVTSGYGSLNWEFDRYRKSSIDKLEILLNGATIDELSHFVPAEKAYNIARVLTSKLKCLIPQQQIEVKIQAKYKGRIIAGCRRAPLRKDVTAKLYGGDRTRKDKLLKKQKKGKKLMKEVGKISIPKQAFIKIYK